jgi:PAS domain S-box-containing protein
VRPDGLCDFVNQRWSEYTGFGRSEVLGDGWQAAIHPEDRSSFLESATAIRRSEVGGETEARLRRRDGEYRWFAFRFAPIANKRGRTVGWCGIASEADERTAPPKGIADGRLRRFVDGLPTQVIFLTPSGELEYVNRQVRDYYGKSLDELKAWASSGAIHPDDLPGVHKGLSRLLGEGAAYDAHQRMLRADGSYRWVRAQMVPCLDAQGNVTRYCSIQTDVQELKQAEDLLAGEVQLLEMVARGLPLLDVLDALSHLVEELATGCFCSTLLLDADGTHFQVGGGPSLPDAYNRVLHGLRIDPCYGPCSLAVNTKALIITVDAINDPRWRGSSWPPLIESYGFASCWSMPILSGDGRVLGVFAVYRREPVGPTDFEQQLIERLTKIAGIAIERAQADESLRTSDRNLRRAHAQLAEGQRLSKTGSFTSDIQLDVHSWSDEFYRIFEIDPATSPSVEVVRDRVHPDDLDLFDRVIQQGLDGGDPDFAFRLLTPNAGVKHVHGVARVIEHVDGRPIFMGTVQDVTEAKLAEAALKDIAAELRRANDDLTRVHHEITVAQALGLTGSFTWDVLADEHHWSEGTHRITEVDPSVTITAEDVRQAVHPEDRTIVDAAMDMARAGHPFEYSARINTPSGAIKFIHVVGHPVEDAEGRLVFVGALKDVTASKTAEAALKASETALKDAHRDLAHAQRQSRIGSFRTDVRADERAWSDELYRIFGFEPGSEISSEKIHARIHPDDQPWFEPAFGRAISEGITFNETFRIVVPDGTVKHLHVIAEVVGREEGRPIYVGAIQDVTEAKLAEEALLASEAGLRRANQFLTLAQSISKTASFRWDVAANDKQWSGEIWTILERDRETSATIDLNDEIVHPEDRDVAARMEQAMIGGRDFDGEYRVVLSSGAIKHLHIVARRLDAERLVYVGAVQDVTELRLGEQALSRARAELAHVARVTTLSALTASIAHEVSQPLSGILNNANTCLRMLAADPPNVSGAMATARRSVRDTTRATEVILRLRALFARKAPAFEMLDLNDVAREVMALSTGELQRGRVSLRTELANALPPVHGDRVQLQQVILNLLLNAADAMAEIEERPRTILVKTRLDDDMAVLSVRDAGVGIEPQVREKLFDAFYSTKPSGMGVGLSISRSIIESHEGRLWAAPNDGPGATFSFSIPSRSTAGFNRSDSPSDVVRASPKRRSRKT